MLKPDYRNFGVAAFIRRGLLAVTTGMVMLSGCGHPQETTRGAALPASPVITVAQLPKVPAAFPVVLQGEMIEKCPVAGCWFILRDKTGTLRVDTNAAGFVVSDVPLHTTVTVAGTVASGSQSGLTATGIRYTP